MINNLTIYLKALRESHEYSLRKVATGLNVSAPFIQDIERGNRIPSRKIANLLVEFYNLDEENQRKLYDAISEANGMLPYDVDEFLRSNPLALQTVIELMNNNKKR